MMLVVVVPTYQETTRDTRCLLGLLHERGILPILQDSAPGLLQGDFLSLGARECVKCAARRPSYLRDRYIFVT